MNTTLLDTRWPELLELTLTAIDTLGDQYTWSWGGGTALAIRLEHRLSFDIDIFFTDSQALRALSPQRNPTVREITDKWQEPGHYLKLQRQEGEIDFIVSALRSDPGTTLWSYGERELPLETPAEVLAKKLHWRGSKALARDVFDLAAVYALEPESFHDAVSASPEGAARIADTIRRRAARLKRELPLAVNPTPTGEQFLDIDLLALAANLDR